MTGKPVGEEIGRIGTRCELRVEVDHGNRQITRERENRLETRGRLGPFAAIGAVLCTVQYRLLPRRERNSLLSLALA